jgi:hypothetical protein
MPVLPLLVLVFVAWLQIQLRKSSKQNTSADDFWSREEKANLTRRKDISALNYISIDINKLPLEDKEDQTINSYRDTIMKLSERKILNLTGHTNTELKELYGVANLNLLTEYDNNYITLVSILYKWSLRLYDSGYITESQAVLEYALALKSDVTGTYKLLAKIYKLQNSSEKIEGLIRLVSEIQIHDKDKLIRSLNELMLS